MSTPQVRASADSNVMKFDNNLNGFFTQAVGREPFLSIAYAGDNTNQWFQLLNLINQGSNSSLRGLEIENTEPDVPLGHSNGASTKLAKGGVDNGQSPKTPEAVVACSQPTSKGIGQPDKCHPGWPLLTPSSRCSSHMQKCSKCSREFCSVVNYKRHVRIHRRSLVFDKASPLSRELLGAFWDSLSLDAIKEIVSLDDVKIENVDGPLFLSELSWVGKLTFIGIPQDYIKAGRALLDIIQATPFVYPIQSHELFRILDDASEKTFLCAGAAISLQKFLFDKDTLRVSLDSRNIVACVSFLLEQKLVKAWIAEKDAEALRCQMLLVEEEEAAQRRQAALSEKRRLKKLKQKENKTKELKNEDKSDFKEGSLDSLESSSSEGTLASVQSDLGSQSHDIKEVVIPGIVLGSETVVHDVSSSNSEQGYRDNIETQEPTSWKPATAEDYQETGLDAVYPLDSEQFYQGTVVEETQGTGNWKHDGDVQSPTDQSTCCNSSVLMKHSCSFKDLKPPPASICQKVWTQKSKSLTELRTNNQPDAVKEMSEKSELLEQSSVLIGSMTVSLNDHDTGNTRWRLSEDIADKPCTSRNVIQPTAGLKGRQNNGNSLVSKTKESDINLPLQSEVRSASSEKSTGCKDEVSIPINRSKLSQLPEPPLSLVFSRKVAEDFLKRRWDEAVASEHLNVDSSCDSQSVDSRGVLDDDSEQLLSQNCPSRGILGNFAKPKARVSSTGSVGVGAYKIKDIGNKEKVQVR